MDEYVALEVNMRPPGGLTVDMWNYANDIDIFNEYANVVVNNRFSAVVDPSLFLRLRRPALWADLPAHPRAGDGGLPQTGGGSHQPISGIFAAALGDFGYLIRSPDLKKSKRLPALDPEEGLIGPR